MVDFEKVGKSLKKTVPWLPIAGDLYDISRGSYKAFHGHPYAGMAQAGLGLFGLGTNIATGGLGGSAVRAGIKAGSKALAKNVIKKQSAKQLERKAITSLNNAKRLTNSGKYQLGSMIAPEILYGFSSNNTPQQQEQQIQQQSKPVSKPNRGYGNSISGGSVGIGQPSQQSINELYNSLVGNEQPTNNQQQPQQTSQPSGQDVNDILKYYQSREDALQPYIDNLSNFADRYRDMQDYYRNLDRYYTGLAGWSGNDRWADFARRHNPVEIEATQTDLYNKLAQQDIDNDDMIREAIGNATIAQYLGLPIEAGLGNDKMFNSAVQMRKIQEQIQARKDLAEANNKIKLYDIQIRKAIADGKLANARYLQSMRNKAAMDRTYLTTLAYGNSDVYDALRSFGYNAPTSDGGIDKDVLDAYGRN